MGLLRRLGSVADLVCSNYQADGRVRLEYLGIKLSHYRRFDCRKLD